jgi:methyl-accepting chemotaxis protein
MRSINNIRIGVKIQITTLTVVALFAVFAVAVLILRATLTARVTATVSATEAAVQVNSLGDSIRQYVARTRSFDELEKDFDACLATMKARYADSLGRQLSIAGGTATLAEHVGGLRSQLEQAESLDKENIGLEESVVTLTGNAAGQSGTYLASISERLSDPVQQKKVSVLERRVIQGASINTISSYTIQTLFKDLRAGLDNKEKLFQFLDQGEKNATVDVERLAGTDFAQLPKDSLAAIQKTRDLATRYVANATRRQEIIARVSAELAGIVGSLNQSLIGDTRASFLRIGSIMNVGLVFFAIFVALVVVLQLVISRSITRPILQTMRLMKEMEQGNFDVKATVSGRDEAGQMLASLNAMAANVGAMIQAVQRGSEQLALSAEEIMAGARKLAEGAQSQASTLEETSASVEELSSSVEQVSRHAQSQSSAVENGAASMGQVNRSIEDASRNLEEIAGLARASVEHARDGATAVGQVVEGITLIAGSSEKIGGIVTVISEIADQTNLLALNASIEAARAGEHGRGFAVVADEVSKLAERSSASTKEIEGLIRDSVHNVGRGVDTARGSQAAMEQIREASEKVQQMITGLSTAMSRQVGSVTDLAKALGNVTEMSRSISAATEEQTTNARQLSAAVENVNEVTQSAASSAEQMSASTEQLSKLAQELRQVAARFRVRSAGEAPALRAAG